MKLALISSLLFLLLIVGITFALIFVVRYVRLKKMKSQQREEINKMNIKDL